MFAVSRKLIPRSSALCIMRVDSAASVCPPNIIVPRQTGETFTPAEPRLRYLLGIGVSFIVDPPCFTVLAEFHWLEQSAPRQYSNGLYRNDLQNSTRTNRQGKTGEGLWGSRRRVRGAANWDVGSAGCGRKSVTVRAKGL